MEKGNFKIIKEIVTGDVTIKQDTQFNNFEANDVIVEIGVRVRIFGTVRGKLTLKQGSKVYLHGSILGKVENVGGEIHLFKN